jgi:hypothetical protein
MSLEPRQSLPETSTLCRRIRRFLWPYRAMHIRIKSAITTDKTVRCGEFCLSNDERVQPLRVGARGNRSQAHSLKPFQIHAMECNHSIEQVANSLARETVTRGHRSDRLQQ